MRRQLLAASVSLALGGAEDAAAVFLNPQGHGQALIYPYYTVRSTNGNAFNTFISVVNHTGSMSPYPSVPSRGKALRVRFREGRNGREVANFNLYLSPNDVWTAAIIPTAEGTALITSDLSCTSPAFAGPPSSGLRELAFSDAQYTGANADGGPGGLDRTREGYVEIIEMANVSGTAAAAFTHNSLGLPANCAVVHSALFVSVSAPSGGLSGTVTLINVANGMDFTANAEALDDVFSRALYRPRDDPYPDWNSSEVKRTSHITANGKQYRLQWAISVDAVSSVLTRSSVMNEYIRDANTLSQTDWVLTFPTRRLHVNSFGTAGPFSAPLQDGAVCERFAFQSFNREERGFAGALCGGISGGVELCPQNLTLCYASSVLSFGAGGTPLPTPVLGSVNRAVDVGVLQTSFVNGWTEATFTGTNARAGLTSLATSVARDLTTDQGSTRVQAFIGLPVVGFMVRTFVNGTLSCAAGSCQGNYGGLFPHKYSQRTAP